MKRAFVVIGEKASASDDFLLDDLPGTSGRLDVGVRCIRAALLVSHGLRRDSAIYLVLRGGPRAPRVLKIDGETAEFIRPDERQLAVLVKKALASDPEGEGFVTVRKGVSVARGSLEQVMNDTAGWAWWVLEEGGPDIREEKTLGQKDAVFFVGDPAGFDPALRSGLRSAGALPLGVGPVSIHAEDAIAVLSNELDRRKGG
jgi:tRNA (pseudouridine54-N1)-methyltransferase